MIRRTSNATVVVSPTQRDEVHHGRNMIRKGDEVWFQRRKGTQTHRARFQYADDDEGGTYYCIVLDDTKHIRYVRPDRVKRIIGRKQREARQ